MHPSAATRKFGGEFEPRRLRQANRLEALVQVQPGKLGSVSVNERDIFYDTMRRAM